MGVAVTIAVMLSYNKFKSNRLALLKEIRIWQNSRIWIS